MTYLTTVRGEYVRATAAEQALSDRLAKVERPGYAQDPIDTKVAL